jgi:predicted component of viral defense system (DUF524 family)
MTPDFTLIFNIFLSSIALGVPLCGFYWFVRWVNFKFKSHEVQTSVIPKDTKIQFEQEHVQDFKPSIEPIKRKESKIQQAKKNKPKITTSFSTERISDLK